MCLFVLSFIKRPSTKQTTLMDRIEVSKMQGIGRVCIRVIVVLTLISASFALGYYNADDGSSDVKEPAYHYQEQSFEIKPDVISKPDPEWSFKAYYFPKATKKFLKVQTIIDLTNDSLKDERIKSLSIDFRKGRKIIFSKFITKIDSNTVDPHLIKAKLDHCFSIETGPLDCQDYALLLSSDIEINIETVNSPHKHCISSNDSCRELNSN